MPASAFDSAIYSGLFGDRDVATLFTDTADVRAMLIVEGALAKAQGAAGLIPEISAAAIHRASREVQIDPGALAAETARSAVVVPALVKAFREEMNAPEHAQYIHWGATSQDIMDTALTLRLRKVLEIAEARLRTVLAALADHAEAHAETPMAARTYGQVATVTSFGAVVAGWGWPMLGALKKLEQVREDVLCVSLSGAAGTLSVMGGDGPKVRAAMAEDLGLRDPRRSWHSDRAPITSLSSWLMQVTACLGKLGEDLLLSTQSGLAEVQLATSGGSSTMPQKQNPVTPSVLAALARHAIGLNTTLQGAALHRQQRDGPAWFTEWLSLPQLCQTAGGALRMTETMVPGLTADVDAMEANIDGDGLGLIYAEALSFALTDQMSRPDAQARTKDLCRDAQDKGQSLIALANAAFPELDASALSPKGQLGQAPAEARGFAKAVRAL